MRPWLIAKTGTPRALSKRATLYALSILAACSPSSQSSEDSEYIQQIIVPQLVEWANGEGQTYSFTNLARLQNYDAICLVSEYDRLESIEGYLNQEFEMYGSDLGVAVPEGRVAIIAVENRSAHVAYVDLKDIGFEIPAERPCLSGDRVILRRVTRQNRYTPLAQWGQGL